MSDYQLRPNVNPAERKPEYSTGTGAPGLWALVIGAIVVVLFAAMFFSGGGDAPLGTPDATPVATPDALGAGAAPGTPQPVAPGE